ncbi:hypothetical protein Emed_001612 [Eimeria media]
MDELRTTGAGPRDASSPQQARQARPPLPLPSWLVRVLGRPRRNPFRRNKGKGKGQGQGRPRHPLGDVRGAGVSLGVSADERGEGPLILSESSETQQDFLNSLKADRDTSQPLSFPTCLDVEELSETDDRSKATARVVPLLPLFVAAASTFSPPSDRQAEGQEEADSHKNSNEETPRTDTSSCDDAEGKQHVPLVTPNKSTISPPEEALAQNDSSDQTSEGPLISRIAHFLLCCSCMKSYTQGGAPQADLEVGREGASRHEAVEQRSESPHAEPLVYGQFVFDRPPGVHQTKPRQAAPKEKGVAFEPTFKTRRNLLPQPADASSSQPPSERQQTPNSSHHHSLNEGPFEHGQEDSPAPEASACCPWVLVSCFSLDGREKNAPLSSRSSGRSARGLSSSWVHLPHLEAWGRHRATGVVRAPRAKCLRRLRDEQRQTWMEYQEVIMEDNSKRRQWVDVGDQGGEDGEAGRLTPGSLN